jgi:hypothetical protein
LRQSPESSQFSQSRSQFSQSSSQFSLATVAAVAGELAVATVAAEKVPAPPTPTHRHKASFLGRLLVFGRRCVHKKPSKPSNSTFGRFGRLKARASLARGRFPECDYTLESKLFVLFFTISPMRKAEIGKLNQRARF